MTAAPLADLTNKEMILAADRRRRRCSSVVDRLASIRRVSLNGEEVSAAVLSYHRRQKVGRR